MWPQWGTLKTNTSNDMSFSWCQGLEDATSISHRNFCRTQSFLAALTTIVEAQRSLIDPSWGVILAHGHAAVTLLSQRSPLK
mmetsp:Transcript_104343/g.202105  ORF Transcript_104343/g.202105 Transcript_104343/m.202105 type:complete len:82 (+) Transcript_104343:477-722(+)